jgi:hypothetical protein
MFGLLLPCYNFGLQRQFVAREAERFDGDVLADTADFEQHPARFDNGDPVIWSAFSAAHTRFSRLLRHRLVWKNANPHLPTTLDMVRDGPTSSLDLPTFQPARLKGLQAHVAETHGIARSGSAAHAPAVLLPLSGLEALWHQHDGIS